MKFGFSLRDQLGGKSNANMKRSKIQAQKYKALKVNILDYLEKAINYEYQRSAFFYSHD